ncbi:MAG: hypothetical protein ACTSR3_22445, partial [Candidatus Helarchaeota archaeon]
MESEEYVEGEEEEEEEPSLLDVISTYRHDADKIIILARSIETILHYTERLEENAITINNYVQYMYEQLSGVMTKLGELDNRVKNLSDFQMQHLQQATNAPANSLNPHTEQELRNEITGIGSKIVDLESTISSLQAQLESFKQTGAVMRTAPVTGVPPTPPSPQGSVVEESLLKPSSFKASASSGPAPKGPGPMGGMSVRMAMMSEIKSRLGKRSGGPIGGGGGGMGGAQKQYVPKIHQPRAAKPIDKGLSKKMNKLLDRKFQMQLGGSVPKGAGSGPPSATGRGPPSAVPRGPPSAPPSATTSSSKIDKKKDKKKGDKKKKDKKKDDKKK